MKIEYWLARLSNCMFRYLIVIVVYQHASNPRVGKQQAFTVPCYSYNCIYVAFYMLCALTYE